VGHPWVPSLPLWLLNWDYALPKCSGEHAREDIPVPRGETRDTKGPLARSTLGTHTPPQAGRLFDHDGTVFFSLFMALWSVLLLEYWKRKSITLAHHWDCFDYEDIEVSCSPWAVGAPGEGHTPLPQVWLPSRRGLGPNLLLPLP
jgi:hypothetical protein